MQSLTLLGVDTIDQYQLNVPAPDVPFLDRSGALIDLHHEGKIRWIGISNVSVEEIEAARAIGAHECYGKRTSASICDCPLLQCLPISLSSTKIGLPMLAITRNMPP